MNLFSALFFLTSVFYRTVIEENSAATQINQFQLYLKLIAKLCARNSMLIAEI